MGATNVRRRGGAGRPAQRSRSSLGAALGVGAAVTLGLLAGACGGDDPPAAPCTSGELSAALGRARSGDVVLLGACRIEGSFVVPPGVTLRGGGRGVTTLAGSAGLVVRLTPGEVPTALEDVSVESAGRLGIVAVGAGSVSITRVSVTASRGYAVGLEDVTRATLTELDALGPVTADLLPTLPRAPAEASLDAVATHGVVLLRVADAELTEVRARGFSTRGALVVGGRLSWRGGGASENYGIGLHVHRAEATLSELDLGGTLRQAGEDTFGAIFSGGASVSSTALDVSGNGAYGILQSEAEASYAGLAARGNGAAALWTQRSTRTELTGASELRDNVLAGFVAVNASGILLEDATIAGTREARRLDPGAPREVVVGDGVQLVSSLTDVVVRRVALEGNSRVGLLLDGAGGSGDGVLLDAVSVSGSGAALGVIAQASIVGPDWDAGVVRDAITSANDAAFTGVLDLVSIVGPDWTPPDALESSGVQE